MAWRSGSSRRTWPISSSSSPRPRPFFQVPPSHLPDKTSITARRGRDVFPAVCPSPWMAGRSPVQRSSHAAQQVNRPDRSRRPGPRRDSPDFPRFRSQARQSVQNRRRDRPGPNCGKVITLARFSDAQAQEPPQPQALNDAPETRLFPPRSAQEHLPQAHLDVEEILYWISPDVTIYELRDG